MLNALSRGKNGEKWENGKRGEIFWRNCTLTENSPTLNR